MSLFIAGINHFDPRGRDQVANWFCSLAERHGGPPSFVAVEFDESHFQALCDYRPRFREWIQARWPNMSETDLNTFEQSLGYEGDVHRLCFDGIEIVWLDQGRSLDRAAFESHVYQRLLCLQFFERNNALMLPGIVSEQVQAYVRADAFNPERSSLFAERILERMRARPWRWAIAVTGASHASDRFENSMRSLIERAGVTCEVRYFCRLE